MLPEAPRYERGSTNPVRYMREMVALCLATEDYARSFLVILKTVNPCLFEDLVERGPQGKMVRKEPPPRMHLTAKVKSVLREQGVEEEVLHQCILNPENHGRRYSGPPLTLCEPRRRLRKGAAVQPTYSGPPLTLCEPRRRLKKQRSSCATNALNSTRSARTLSSRTTAVFTRRNMCPPTRDNLRNRAWLALGTAPFTYALAMRAMPTVTCFLGSPSIASAPSAPLPGSRRRFVFFSFFCDEAARVGVSSRRFSPVSHSVSNT
ncbi:hypothetical protein Q5P01_016585 [Channa striata]|uniref:Uncharacterized protein n=1 Tax=Channa striata TaxID=64152 RepID=A0AA88M9Q1_CHASR|nr:hypothetical protein Q5P01_016585 [Channa striata]